MKAHEVIRRHIDECGLKQKAIANKIGINDTLFNRALLGSRKLSADEFLKCCLVLGLEFSDFQETSDDKN